MKKFRKIMAVLVAAMMIVATMVPAWAADKVLTLDPNKGTLAGPPTITGPTIDFTTQVDNPTYPSNTRIKFIGWTETKYDPLTADATTPATVYAKTGPYTTLTLGDESKTLYALWGYDYNEDESADAAEAGTLVTVNYDPTEGTNAPDSFMTKTGGVQITLSDKEPTPPELHPEYIFLGWYKSASSPQKTLFSYADKSVYDTTYSSSLKNATNGLIDTVPDTTTVTYYAFWGEDTNNDGIADVTQTKATVTYNMNKSALNIEGILRNIEKNEGSKADDTDFFVDATYRLEDPSTTSTTYPNAKKGTAYDEVHDNPVDVAFIGWSKTQTDKCYDSGDDYIPIILKEYTVPAGGATLYAVWGYDENGDGVADVLEDAEANNIDTVRITVNAPSGTANKETHYAYKVFDVTRTADVDDPAPWTQTESNLLEELSGFAYTISTNNRWYNYISSAAIDGVYVDLTATSDSNIYNVTWKGEKTADRVKAFAKLLNDARKDGTINPAPTGREFESGDILYTQPGYYLITSSLGTNLVLATTNVDLHEKNNYVSDEKKNLKKSVTVGEYTTYFITVKLPASVDTSLEAKVHDTLDPQLKFDKTSLGYQILANEPVYASLGNTWAPISDIGSLVESPADDCTFEIIIDLDKKSVSETGFGTSDKYVVFKYQAELTSEADTYDPGFVNTEYTEYSHYKTTPNSVTVKTFEFEFKKVNGSNTTEQLEGAVFELYKGSVAPANIVSFKRNKYYKDNTYLTEATTSVLGTDYTGATGTAYVADLDDDDTTTNLVAGDVTVSGLGEGTYILVEKLAPKGYQRLTKNIVIVIDEDGNQTYTEEGEGASFATGDATTHAFDVNNFTSSMMPATGGMGTTVLYIVGGMLVILAGAYLFFSRKKTA